MILEVVAGKNYKNFVVIKDLVTKEDLDLYEVIKKVISRSEFKPFLKGFNKTISYTYLFNDYIFPAQFLSDVRKQIDNLSTKPIQVLNEEILYDNISREEFDAWVNSMKFPDKYDTTSEEYKYQRDSVFEAIKNKISRIEVSVSGGKTFITYLFCRYLFEKVFRAENTDNPKKILIVLPSKLLCQQLKSDFIEYDTFMERKLGVETIFSGAKRLIGADIVAGTFQSLSNYDQEYFDDFGALICDEVHRAKAYSIRNEIQSKMLFSEYFFGMTGTTPEYKTLDYLHIVSMFGPALVIKTAKEIIDSGVATPVHIHSIRLEYIEANDFSKDLKANGITGKDKYAVEKEFIQTYEPRTNILVKLLKGFTNNSLIIVDTIDYCLALDKYLTEQLPDYKFFVIYGEVKDRDAIIQAMKDSTSNHCIIGTYGTMSTGVSIPSLENLYLIDGGKSQIRIGQTIGRLMRIFVGKTYARLFDFFDDIPQSALKNQSIERLKYYKEKQFPVKVTNVRI